MVFEGENSTCYDGPKADISRKADMPTHVRHSGDLVVVAFFSSAYTAIPKLGGSPALHSRLDNNAINPAANRPRPILL